MKVTIAIDSLKGSLTSLEAGQAAAEGSGEYTKMPISVSGPWRTAEREQRTLL